MSRGVNSSGSKKYRSGAACRTKTSGALSNSRGSSYFSSRGCDNSTSSSSIKALLPLSPLFPLLAFL